MSLDATIMNDDPSQHPHAEGSSVDPEDVARFSRIAAEWWDPKGKFAPLHRFNPVRLRFIRDQALLRFGKDGKKLRPFEGAGHLFVNGEHRAEHAFSKVIAAASYDGFAIGSDPGNQVSTAYHGANPYPAAIHHVVIDIQAHPPTVEETLRFMRQMKINV